MIGAKDQSAAVGCNSQIEYISEPRSVVFPDDWYDISYEHHFWFQWRLATFLQQMSDLGQPLDQQARVLDIGCGTGVLARQLEQKTSWQVDGVDLNEEALRCHKKSRGRILYYDILEARSAFLEHYDYVLIFDVLEHLTEARSFLSAALKHLKMGGLIVVNVPAIQRLYSKYDVVAGHCRRFDEASLTSLFEDLRVNILDVRFWGLSMVPLLFLRKHMVNRVDSEENIISRGFEPPNKLLHRLLRVLMRLETRIVRRPWLGSSILLAARKTGPEE